MMHIKRRITKTYFNIAKTQYTPLIRKLSFIIGVDEKQTEELQSRGLEELLKCMICYNGHGSFITFLYHRLRGIFRHLRDVENRARRIITIQEKDMINIVETKCDMDLHIMVQECLDCLDDKERNIITELFFNNKTIREISEDCGNIVPSTISRIKTRAIDKMRQRCKVE